MPAHDPGNTHNIEFVEQNRFDVIDRTASRSLCRDQFEKVVDRSGLIGYTFDSITGENLNDINCTVSLVTVYG